MDEAHEQVAGLGAKERLVVAEAVFAMEDRHFQGLLAAVMPPTCSAPTRNLPF
jgi:hypothetical protein